MLAQRQEEDEGSDRRQAVDDQEDLGRAPVERGQRQDGPELQHVGDDPERRLHREATDAALDLQVGLEHADPHEVGQEPDGHPATQADGRSHQHRSRHAEEADERDHGQPVGEVGRLLGQAVGVARKEPREPQGRRRKQDRRHRGDGQRVRQPPVVRRQQQVAGGNLEGEAEQARDPVSREDRERRAHEHLLGRDSPSHRGRTLPPRRGWPAHLHHRRGRGPGRDDQAGHQPGQHPELLADGGHEQVFGGGVEQDHRRHDSQANRAQRPLRGGLRRPHLPGRGGDRGQQQEVESQPRQAGAERLPQVAVVHEGDQRPGNLAGDQGAGAQPGTVLQQRGHEEPLPVVDADRDALGHAQPDAACPGQLLLDPVADDRPEQDGRDRQPGRRRHQLAPGHPAGDEQHRHGADREGEDRRVGLAGQHPDHVDVHHQREPELWEAGVAGGRQGQREQEVEQAEGAHRAVEAEQRRRAVDRVPAGHGLDRVVVVEDGPDSTQVQQLGERDQADRDADQHHGVQQEAQVGC